MPFETHGDATRERQRSGLKQKKKEFSTRNSSQRKKKNTTPPRLRDTPSFLSHSYSLLLETRFKEAPVVARVKRGGVIFRYPTEKSSKKKELRKIDFFPVFLPSRRRDRKKSFFASSEEGKIWLGTFTQSLFQERELISRCVVARRSA